MAKDKEKIEDKANEPVANCDQLPMAADIQPMIRVIRGQQVIIDRDLALLYGVETRALNQAVKRNIERFPDDFMFQLDKEDVEILKSQNVTSSWGGDRRLPYAFTEQGIAMLSSVLKSQTAVEVNIRIMRAFVSMRRFIATNAQLFQRLETIEYHRIFYDGQVFDAYRFVSDLIRKAKRSIALIDNYVDDTVLTLLDKREKGVTATIYTQRVSDRFQLDVDRHNAQYPPVRIERFNKAHDRFLLIDEEVYHIGASIKDLGKKWFGFTLMRDIPASEIINRIIFPDIQNNGKTL